MRASSAPACQALSAGWALLFPWMCSLSLHLPAGETLEGLNLPVHSGFTLQAQPFPREQPLPISASRNRGAGTLPMAPLSQTGILSFLSCRAASVPGLAMPSTTGTAQKRFLTALWLTACTVTACKIHLFFFFFPWSPSRYKSSTYGSLSKLFPEKEFHPLLRAGLDMQHPEIKMVWLTGWKGMGANSLLLCWACSSSATATTVSQGCPIPEFHPRQIMRNSNFLICTCNSFWKCPATGATEKVQDHIFNNLPWSTVSWAAVKIASLVMGPTNAFAHLLSCIFAGLHT